ncbi:hypothetical protein IV203_018804 [Nitzschia inconspicua]|uniref:Uncharacterized protein n=1 Tax=Nitzschia inconspicua TaxID=303405 RepID=A0A9K3M5V0_9STRA|nr:hypothetical protein IV203_018804 [Nitzschia inconspicua]
MVWSDGGGAAVASSDKMRHQTSQTVKEMQCHYAGGVTTHLSKSTTSYGREMIATRLQQKHIGATTKNHQLPIKTSPSPNKVILPPQQSQQPQRQVTILKKKQDTSKTNRRRTWFGGRSNNNNNDTTLHPKRQHDNSTSTFRPQTPNHKVSAGRSFADRMIRAVSPTKKRTTNNRYNQTNNASSIYPMTTAALTSVQPVVVVNHNNNVGKGRRTPHSTCLPESRDDDYYSDQENNNGSIINNTPPIHELKDRLARIEQRLMMEESDQYHHRSTPPPQKYQSMSTAKTLHQPYSSHPHWDPPSTTSKTSTLSTPTLFAHTKKLVEEEKERIAINTWPSSEEDDDDDERDPRRRRHSAPLQRTKSSTSKRDIPKEVGKYTKMTNHEPKTASSHQTPWSVQRSKERRQSKIHHAIVVQQQHECHNEEQQEQDQELDVREEEEENSVSSLPPTPRISNSNTSTSWNSKEAQSKEETNVQPNESDHPKFGEQEITTKQFYEHLKQQTDLEAGQSTKEEHPTHAPINCKSIVQSRFSLPTVQCTMPQNAFTDDENNNGVNSIVAIQPAHKNQTAASHGIDNTIIDGVLSDLSSSTNGNTDGGTMNSQNAQFGKGRLTIHNQSNASSLLFSKMNCANPLDSAHGPVERMKSFCAGEESGSHKRDFGADKTRAEETVTTRPSMARVPREIPLVPGRSTPDISLMDHPDHESVTEEDCASPKVVMDHDPNSQSKSTSPTIPQDRDPSPRNSPSSHQNQIPIIPNASNEEEIEEAQEYWESMYLEVGNTYDVLQDLMQTPTNQENPLKVTKTENSKPKTSPHQQRAAKSPKNIGGRVLFSSLQSKPKQQQRPLIPKRSSTPGRVSRLGENPFEKEHSSTRSKTPEKSAKREKKNGMTLAIPVDSITNLLTVKSDEMERQQRDDETRQTTAPEVKKSKAEIMERKTIALPPSAVIKKQRETQKVSHSCHPHTNIRETRQHEADDALVDILHLHNRSLPIGKVHKYKLSSYHPKSDNLSKNHWGWFGRRKVDDRPNIVNSNREYSGNIGGRTIEAMASSAGSTITAETCEGARKHRRQVLDVSNAGSGSYHSLEQSREDVAASTSVSLTTASNGDASEEWEDTRTSQPNNKSKSSIPRATTYDEIIEDLKTFESQLPIADFAVVEVGDDSDTEQAHAYRMNKRLIENESRSGQDRDEPLLVEMPFGLETIDELSLEESFSMGFSSDSEENRKAKEDSNMEKVKLGVSFAEQLQQLQNSARPMRRVPTSPGKSYHI